MRLDVDVTGRRDNGHDLGGRAPGDDGASLEGKDALDELLVAGFIQRRPGEDDRGHFPPGRDSQKRGVVARLAPVEPGGLGDDLQHNGPHPVAVEQELLIQEAGNLVPAPAEVVLDAHARVGHAVAHQTQEIASLEVPPSENWIRRSRICSVRTGKCYDLLRGGRRTGRGCRS